jgi:hypothetical protein
VTLLLPALLPKKYIPDGISVYEREHWKRDRLIKYVVSTTDGYHIVDFSLLIDVMAFLRGYKGMQALGMIKEVER